MIHLEQRLQYTVKSASLLDSPVQGIMLTTSAAEPLHDILIPRSILPLQGSSEISA